MKCPKAVIVLLVMVSFALLSSTVHAAKPVTDPWQGRVGIGLGVGGGFGAGGSAFQAQLSVTYWFIKYLSATIGSGYGFYTANYTVETTDANGNTSSETKQTTVNFVPSELLLTVHLFPDAMIAPYLGPGIGADYIWYKLENKRQSGTIFSAIGRAGILYRISRNVGLTLGARYTQPLNTFGDLKDQKQGTLSFEGGLSLFF
jgi:outer membrane protein W